MLVSVTSARVTGQRGEERRGTARRGDKATNMEPNWLYAGACKQRGHVVTPVTAPLAVTDDDDEGMYG